MKDYYKVLGVSKTASQDEIKKAFYKLAHEHHPDKKGGDSSKFKDANEAYQVLGNTEKRKNYDQFGSADGRPFGGYSGQGGGYSAQGGGFGGFNTGNVDFDFGDLGGMGDIFGDFFGGGGRQGGRRSSRGNRGGDLEITLEIDFKDAIFGVEKVIYLSRKVKCSHCHGNGAEPGSKVSTCKTCGGAGQVASVQRTILGNFQTVRECPDCGGEGKINEKKCHACAGKGVETKKEEIKINIPAGISDGEALQMSGGGNTGAKGGAAGDLFIHVRIKPDKNFTRKGYDIFSSATINFSQAALGGEIEVNTVYGPVILKIPAGTQSGKQFILRSKGVPHLRSSQVGDQTVEIIVATPTHLSSRAKELLEELAKEQKETKKGWF